MCNCRVRDWRTKIAFDQRLGRPDEIGIAPVTRPAPKANCVRSVSQRRAGTASHASCMREMIRKVSEVRLSENASYERNPVDLSRQATQVSSDDEPTLTETTWTGGTEEEPLDFACGLIRENCRSRQAAPPAKPDRDRLFNAQVSLFKEKLAQELARRIGTCLAARGEEGRPSTDEIERAIRDSLFGDEKTFRLFLDEYAIPRRLVGDAARAAVEGFPLAGELRRCSEAPAPGDGKTLAIRHGRCAGAGGAVLNMARHGLVKGIASGLAYAVKEAIAVAFIELLGLSGLDFFWSSLMGNVAAMVYYGFGYDELRGLISDNVNACFLGPTFKQDRNQSLGWTTWGELLTEGLPRIAFSPAGQAIMGAPGVSSKTQLPLYVLSKIGGKSMANFGAGFVQAGLRRAMPGTYRQLPRDRRDFNALRTSRANLQSLNGRFSRTRRFRAAPEVVMKILVYEVSYAITAGMFANLYPMAEEAAGYHSDPQARFLQTLVFNTISVGLMLVMLLGGRLLWNRCGPDEAAASEIGDIENQLATDDAVPAEDGSLAMEPGTDSDDEEPASDDTEASTGRSQPQDELPHSLAALLKMRIAGEDGDPAFSDPDAPALFETLRMLLADEDGSFSDQYRGTDSDYSFDGGWLSDEDCLTVGEDGFSDGADTADETTPATDTEDDAQECRAARLPDAGPAIDAARPGQQRGRPRPQD